MFNGALSSAFAGSREGIASSRCSLVPWHTTRGKFSEFITLGSLSRAYSEILILAFPHVLGDRKSMFCKKFTSFTPVLWSLMYASLCNMGFVDTYVSSAYLFESCSWWEQQGRLKHTSLLKELVIIQFIILGLWICLMETDVHSMWPYSKLTTDNLNKRYK